MRGAASDLKLVHLDGAPVYAPFPLGGLLDPFTPELLGAADVYLGGAPARYDGGLSYVMDLRTRAPGTDSFLTSGYADLLSAGVVAELGDGGRNGALASVRGMHPLGSTDLFGAGLPYDYSEGIVRGDVRLGENATLSLTGFANDESVLVTGREGGSRTIDWGNRAGSVRLNASLAETAAEITASMGHYEATLPFGGESPLLAEGTADRLRFSADLARNAGDLAIRYGASVEEQAFSATSADPAATRLPTYSMDAKGRVIGGYAELSFQPLPRVRVRGGTRLDRFSTGGQIEAAPRFSATWLVTDRAAITVAGGVYHQFLRAPDEVLVTAASPSDLR